MGGRNRWVVPAAAGAAALAVVGVAAARGSAGGRGRGQGLVVALPGRPVRLCSGVGPQVVPPTRTPAYCAIGLTLVGADLGRLADRQERDGAVWGPAEVTGVYRDRTVTITAQDAPPAADPGLKPFAPGLPADEQVHRLRGSAGADLVGIDHLLLRKLA